jgi:phosphoglycerate dehydrogenase-like enzyme
LPAAVRLPRLTSTFAVLPTEGCHMSTGSPGPVASPAAARILLLANTPRTFPGFDESAEMIAAAGHVLIDPGARWVPQDEVATLIGDVDAVIVGGTHELHAAPLRQAGRLKVIVRQGIGIDHMDVDVATELGIVVSNTAGSNADSVADHTFAILLALLRDVVRHDAATRAGHGWDHRPPLGQLAGRTMGVVGTGNIGRGVVRRAAAGFGMSVLCFDPIPNAALAETYGARYVPLDELLARSDVVSLHIPITPETRGLIGARELALMKPDAILVNTARSQVVDTAALADALRARRIAGAAVDAWHPEPATESELVGLPNVVVTPHVGGNSVQSSYNARTWSVRNLHEALAGQPRDVVNPEVLRSAGLRLPLVAAAG